MSTKDQAKTSMTDLVIRRRGGLMALVALTALGLSGGYLWRFSQTGGGVPLLLGVVLGLVAVFHGLAWGDARTPLLVADDTGLRVRLGGDWTGIPWSHIERVEVDERGRVSDGHVAVIATESADELANARWRSRLGAVLNRWFYDAPLVVPYGLTTTVTAVDVPATLTRLAAGRAPIAVLDGAVEEPEPTVALTGGVRDGDGAWPEQDHGDEGLDTAAAVMADRDELAVPADGFGADAETGPADEPAGKPRKPRRPLIAVREAPAMPLAKMVAALRSHPARREEVTLPVRRELATDGTLALSEPYADQVTQPLPEIQHLRRREEDDDRHDDRHRQRHRQRHGRASPP